MDRDQNEAWRERAGLSPNVVAGAGSKLNNQVEKLLKSMTVADMIGQMSQLHVSLLLEPRESDDNGPQLRVNQTALNYYIGELGVGSVLNNNDGVSWSARDYRAAMLQIQATARNHSRPPVIWGIDSIHGASSVHGATLTPHPLNLAATINVTVAYQAGTLASRDTRAAGLNWLFSPLLGLALQPRWSRVYETFDEDPLLVGSMASHLIQGIQFKCHRRTR